MIINDNDLTSSNRISEALINIGDLIRQETIGIKSLFNFFYYFLSLF